MGTPAFAAHSLSLLAERHEVVEVFTQPDRPAGRGRKLQAPPVKLRAEELGLPVFQPTSVRDEESLSRVTSHAPDVIAVVGYGQFIPKRIRDLPPHGCVNVHSSLLPKYRGAAPVNWAIARGETRTGVTTIRLERELDAGGILMAREAEIGRHETASQLQVRLEPIGAELLIDTLAALETGTLEPQPQDHAAATRGSAASSGGRVGGLVADRRRDSQSHARLRPLARYLQFLPWAAPPHPRCPTAFIRRTRARKRAAQRQPAPSRLREGLSRARGGPIGRTKTNRGTGLRPRVSPRIERGARQCLNL